MSIQTFLSLFSLKMIQRKGEDKKRDVQALVTGGVNEIVDLMNNKLKNTFTNIGIPDALVKETPSRGELK